MRVDPLVLLAILLMASTIYATRAMGFWLASRLPLSERAETWLNYIPGAILVSIVAPTVLASGLTETLAAVVVVLVALRTASLPLAMVAGVASVLVLRMFL
ncbi:MAG: AzlD domain-containing protein [Rubrobacteraceae bacterium]|nr:AzlD domain-containing protein [Rubrobacteraceae bacterium]MDQ5809995.1 AzlD domain-containing protein [Actinomycetota bacterium]